MRSKSQVGHIVWHDLLTNAVDKAKQFYAELLSWDYQVEHASDCSWQPGEADYPLIMSRGIAHGGMIDFGPNDTSRWLGYVSVEDVDAVAQRAVRLGATLDREPFDVPGVGRNAVIQDPQGALIGLTTPTHSFPPPEGAFLADVLITADVELAKRFYTELFAWQAQDKDKYIFVRTAEDAHRVGTAIGSPADTGPAGWVPMIATTDINLTLTRAKALGASRATQAADESDTVPNTILIDPTGALFGLSPTSTP
ncbi:VOC family protein [Nodosilinea sp. LEGE 07088]|uniref:VOC family protein n=1 Tax=Nodosilinea sp. LEGE 07088 TaxID=2777968 RepID=UPI001881DDA9|nr:VOC family protein [Nodosilinea sp. LEGE 07088]MBE9137094.1 VOC family protein [Nodosilinea sp. LEGE 07088]